MQKPCTCDFLHGPLTASYAINNIKAALESTESDEKQVEVMFYKKDGEYVRLRPVNSVSL